MTRHFSCLILTSLFLAAGSAHAIQDCDLNGQSVNPANGNTTAGKTGLMRCKDRDSGVIQREQELQNGKFMGIVRYYDDGKLKSEHSVNEQGNRHGRAREFDPKTGQLISDSTYENGSEFGVSKRFHPNGQLRRATYYEKGSSGEKAYAEFNSGGQLYQLRCADHPVMAPVVDDAKLCGFGGGASKLDMFDERGALYAHTSYLGGERVRFEQLYGNGKTQLLIESSATRRLEQQFSQDGVKRKEEERTLDGKRVTAARLSQFSESGTLTREQRWGAEGMLLSDASFYLNGQPRSKSEYTRDGKTTNLVETEYRDDGKLASKATYIEINRRRQPTGTHQFFNAAGRVVGESTYDERGRITREKAWDDAGVLLRDDAVFEDGSRKAFAK